MYQCYQKYIINHDSYIITISYSNDEEPKMKTIIKGK